jgi:hypothetical protein
MMIAYRASGDFVRLAVVVLVISCLPVAVHGHNIREHGARAVVLVRIEKDAETLELVYRSKDWSRLSALLREPHCETISVKVALAIDLKLDRHLVA